MVASALLLGGFLSSAAVLGAYIPHVPRAEPDSSRITGSHDASRTVFITQGGRTTSSMVYPADMEMHGAGTGTGGTGMYIPTPTSSEEDYMMSETDYPSLTDVDDPAWPTSIGEIGGDMEFGGDMDMTSEYPTMTMAHNTTMTTDPYDIDMPSTMTDDMMDDMDFGAMTDGGNVMTVTETTKIPQYETMTVTRDVNTAVTTQMSTVTDIVTTAQYETETATVTMSGSTVTIMSGSTVTMITPSTVTMVKHSTVTMMSASTVLMSGSTFTTVIQESIYKTKTIIMKDDGAPEKEAPTTMVESAPAPPSITPSSMPTSQPNSPDSIFSDKSRYAAYGGIPQGQLVFISNHEFPEVAPDGKIKTIANQELENSMVSGKAYYEELERGDGKPRSCTAPAFTGGEPQDELIYCNKESRYGIRMNNLMDSAWTENCWNIINDAVWLSQAVTSQDAGILEGQVPEEYANANAARPTKFFKHAEVAVSPSRPWTVIGQVFKSGSPTRLAYITLENPGCPDNWQERHK
ncbi:hypothetical protein TWF730_007516 [Orbilia blumenaviensis]|uniref:Uncharacterized protein n=1 Tax=Orbilia blumenaviensis TaxID=1796055 RepID=A0AAV9V8Q5_9PEZI